MMQMKIRAIKEYFDTLFIILIVAILTAIFFISDGSSKAAGDAEADLNYVDLSNWEQKGDPNDGTWDVQEGSRSLIQTINGNPTYYVSPDEEINKVFQGTIEVKTTGDDDYIGFVLGYNEKTINGEDFEEYILFDWKQADQNPAKEGFRLAYVKESQSNPFSSSHGGTDDPFWVNEKEINSGAEGQNENVFDKLDTKFKDEGGFGWADNTKYYFKILYTETRIRVVIDGMEVFDVEGNFKPGKFGFYNYSQEQVEYGMVQSAPGQSAEAAPVAQSETYLTELGQPLEKDRFGGVLQNDYDPNGDAISAVMETEPENSKLDLESDGSFIYTPNSDFSGSDQFEYVYEYVVKDSNGNKSDPVTATIVVTDEKDPNPPTDISLDNTKINLNTATNGTLVGRLTTTDESGDWDEHDYMLIDNSEGRFGIKDDQIIINDMSKLEKGIDYEIEVRSTDLKGDSTDKTFKVEILNNKLITFKYEDFTDTTRNELIQLNNAEIKESFLRITPAEINKSGSAFYRDRVSLADERSFSTYFTLKMHGGTGADGITFAIQTDSNTAGTTGSGLGYGGIKPSIGIEFDTFSNEGEPDGNHVGINKDGNVNSTVENSEDPGFTLDDGKIHAWVDYDGNNDKLSVYVSQTADRPNEPLITKNIDLTEILDMNEVYVGFTAATGGSTNNHDVLSWYFQNKYDPIDADSSQYYNAPTSVELESSTSNDNLAATIKATIKDAAGKVVPNQEVAFTANSGNIAPSTSITDENGVAETTLSDAQGLITVKAVANGGAYNTIDVGLGNFTINFNANQGSEVGSNKTGYNTTINPPDEPVRTGYAFEGWYTNKEGTDAWDFQADTVTGDLTLYAKWKKNKYTVDFDSNGGTGVESMKQDYDSIVVIPKGPSRTGYKFQEWNESEDGTGSSYNPDDPFKIPAENVTLYAQWKVNTYTVSFDAGEAVDDPESMEVTFGEKYGDQLPKLERTGYTFEGWYLNLDDPNTEVTSGTTVNTAKDHILYARWKINEYTVTFKNKDGTIIGDTTANHDAKVNQQEDPARDGYDFAGWFKDDEFSEDWNFDSDTVTSDTTIYAKWKSHDDVVSDALDSVAISYQGDDRAENVTKDVELPTNGDEGTKITWSSDDEDVINPKDGQVTRPYFPAKDQEVTLTATVTKDDAEKTRDFKLTVIAKTAFETIQDFTANKNADDLTVEMLEATGAEPHKEADQHLDLYKDAIASADAIKDETELNDIVKEINSVIEVITAIDNFPETSDIRLEDKKSITKAKDLYDELHDKQRKLVYKDSVTKLTNAEAIIQDLESETPTLSLSQNPVEPTNEDVTIEASIGTDKVDIAETKWTKDDKTENYFKDGGESFTGNQFNVQENGSYTVFVKNEAGNIAVETINITNIDKTKPTTTSVIMTSNNNNPGMAKVGDTVTLTFKTAKDVENVQATIAGQDAKIIDDKDGDATTWVATYPMQKGDDEGPITFTIDMDDLVGNAADQITTLTGDNKPIIFDKTAPDAPSVTMISNHVDPQYAKVGNKIIIEFASDEIIEKPTVEIADNEATVAGAGKKWTATYTMAGDDEAGDVDFSIKLKDLAGNTSQISQTTNNRNVIFDKTYTVTFVSNGGTSVEAIETEYGTTITKPKNPARKDYTFTGWYTNASLTKAWSFDDDVITKDIKLYAGWDNHNAQLTRITTSDGSFNAKFDPDRTDYEVRVKNTVESITLSAQTAYGSSSITVNGKLVKNGERSQPIFLDAGETKTVEIVVTAQDGTTKTYRLEVTRLLPEVESQPIDKGQTVEVADEEIQKLDEGGIVRVELTEELDDVENVNFPQNQLAYLIKQNATLKIIKSDVKVNIPTSNFDQDEALTLTLKRIKPDPKAVPASDLSISSVFDFTLRQGKRILNLFDYEIELIFPVQDVPYENPEELKVYYWNEDIEVWELAGGTYENGEIRVMTNHFSTFAVFHPGELKTAMEGQESGNNDDVDDADNIDPDQPGKTSTDHIEGEDTIPGNSGEDISGAQKDREVEQPEVLKIDNENVDSVQETSDDESSDAEEDREETKSEESNVANENEESVEADQDEGAQADIQNDSEETNSNVWMWFLIIFVAALLLLIIYKRKRNQQEE